MGTGDHGRPALPTEMVEGLEQRRTPPAQRDDPAGLAARLADLRVRVAEAAGSPPGGWETVSAERAAHELAGRGADLASARSLVAALRAGYRPAGRRPRRRRRGVGVRPGRHRCHRPGRVRVGCSRRNS